MTSANFNARLVCGTSPRASTSAELSMKIRKKDSEVQVELSVEVLQVEVEVFAFFPMTFPRLDIDTTRHPAASASTQRRPRYSMQLIEAIQLLLCCVQQLPRHLAEILSVRKGHLKILRVLNDGKFGIF